MNEPLFGSVSPPWPPAPFPPSPWLVSSIPVAGRPVAQGPMSFASGLVGGMSPPLMSPVTSLASGGLTSAAGTAGTMPVGATIPSFAGSEVAIGVPVPALLATVAVRRGQPLGPTNDQEIEDFIYDALELLPGSGEVDVRCEAGRVTVTGTVHYKRLKRDVGEIAWAIPGVNDVNNTITITARRRSRAGTQSEPQAAVSRKSA
jgi:BON domain